MMREDGVPSNREEGPGRFRCDSSLLSSLQVDIDAASAAGNRLAASANTDETPLPVVRLPSTPSDDGPPLWRN